MLAHLALEVAAVIDLDLNIKRLERTRVQNRFFEVILFVRDGVQTVHGSIVTLGDGSRTLE